MSRGHNHECRGPGDLPLRWDASPHRAQLAAPCGGAGPEARRAERCPRDARQLDREAAPGQISFPS